MTVHLPLKVADRKCQRWPEWTNMQGANPCLPLKISGSRERWLLESTGGLVGAAKQAVCGCPVVNRVTID